MTPSTAVAFAGAPGSSSDAATEQERGGRRHDDDRDRGRARTGSGCRDPRLSGSGADGVRSLPRRPRSSRSRCSPARGAASRRRSAGRSPGPARRSAGRAARANGAGRSRPVVGEVSVVRPPLRSTSTTHSTISPPIASTAGIIASSEPPVVRMSSTSRTRSPGSIRKPRRNSRWVVPSSARTSSAKMLRTPSWRAVSKARMIPPVVGPATRSTSGSPSRPRPCCGEEPAQLAGRGRILEDLELLDVGVAVAAALEQEVALAERPRAAEQRLGPQRDGVPQRGVERRVERSSSAEVYAAARPSRPVFDALRRRRAGLLAAAPSRSGRGTRSMPAAAGTPRPARRRGGPAASGRRRSRSRPGPRPRRRRGSRGRRASSVTPPIATTGILPPGPPRRRPAARPA